MLKFIFFTLFLFAHNSFSQSNDRQVTTQSFGKLVIAPEFENARPFVEGIASVKVSNNWGYIDTKGNWVVKPSNAGNGPYAEPFPFVKGLATFTTQKGLKGYINSTGKPVIYPSFWEASNFSESLAAVKVGGINDGKWGYIDTTGNLVIQPQFDKALNFSEGLAAVLIDQKNGKWGYINKQGSIVIPPQFKHALSFSDGLAAIEMVAVDGFDRWGFINNLGNLVVKPQFNDVYNFSEGLALVSSPDSRGYFYIDKQGQVVVKPRFKNPYVIIPGNENEGRKDKNGDPYSNPPFDLFSHGKKFTKGLAVIQYQVPDKERVDFKDNIREGYIDSQGNIVIPPAFEVAGYFSEDLAPVRVDNKWGYIDTQGKIVIPPQFDSAGAFSGGLAPVRVGKKWGYITK